MTTSMRVSRTAVAVSLALLLLVPLTLTAQTGELQATIRAAILSDPRTAAMSEAEIDAMVAALAQEAAAQSVTSQDIMWRPQEEGGFTSEIGLGSCNMLCKLTNAFGFDGSDVTIPIGLGVSSALLLFLIGSPLDHQ